MQPTQDPTPITYAVESDEHADKLHAIFVALGYAPVRVELPQHAVGQSTWQTLVMWDHDPSKDPLNPNEYLKALGYSQQLCRSLKGQPRVRQTLPQLAAQINLTTRELLIAEALQAGWVHCNLNEATGLQSRTCTWLVRSLLVKAGVSRVEKFLELLRPLPVAPAYSPNMHMQGLCADSLRTAVTSDSHEGTPCLPHVQVHDEILVALPLASDKPTS